MLLELLRLDRGTFRPSESLNYGCQDRKDFLDLKELSEKYGKDDALVETLLLEIAEIQLKEARFRILMTGDSDIQSVHVLLSNMSDAASLYGPKKLSDDIQLVVHILHGVGYSRCMNWMQAIKSLNCAINCCNRDADGGHRPGLSEALILLSEAYSKLRKEKEAIHSARLAVTFAHKRIAGKSDCMSSGTAPIPSVLGPILSGGLPCYSSPLLQVSPALLASYYNLAVVLESSGPAAEGLALEWYIRVINAALKMQPLSSRGVVSAQETIASALDAQDVDIQVKELKQFSLNARARLEMKPRQLSNDARSACALPGLLSPLEHPLTSRMREARSSSCGRTSRSTVRSADPSRGKASLSPRGSSEYGQWNISDTESDLKVQDRGAKLPKLTDQYLQSHPSFDFSVDDSNDSYGGKCEDLFVAVDSEADDYNDAHSSVGRSNKKSPIANMISHSSKGSSKELKAPASPSSRSCPQSRPQSAQPRLLSDPAASMPFRTTPPATPPSRPQSSSGTERRGPGGIRDCSRAGAAAEEAGDIQAPVQYIHSSIAVNSSTYPSREDLSDTSQYMESLYFPEAAHPGDSHFYAQPEYQQQQYYLTIAALSSPDHFLHSDHGSHNNSRQMDQGHHNHAEVTIERSVSYDNDYQPLRRRNRDLPRIKDDGQGVDARQFTNKMALPQRRLSRTQSDLSYMSPSVSPPLTFREARRKSELFAAFPALADALAAKRLQGADRGIKENEEKKGKAVKLRQELLNVHNRAAVIIQRMARGYICRVTIYSARGQKDTDGKRNGRSICSRARPGATKGRSDDGCFDCEGNGQRADSIEDDIFSPQKRQTQKQKSDKVAEKKAAQESGLAVGDVGQVSGRVGEKISSFAAPAWKSLAEIKASEASAAAAKSAATAASQMLRKAVREHTDEMKRILVSGSKIEGRYKAMRLGKKSCWLKGKVCMVHLNGSFDLVYENGTKEFGVRAEHIRVRAIVAVGAKDSESLRGAPESSSSVRSQRIMHSSGSQKLSPKPAPIPTRTPSKPIEGVLTVGPSAAEARVENARDMNQHMLSVTLQMQGRQAAKEMEEGAVRERHAVKLQSLARGYLERRRHRGLLLQIKRCMDLRVREMEVTRREARVWDRFEGIVSRAKEDVTRSLGSLVPHKAVSKKDVSPIVISRKNSSSSSATTGEFFSPATIESPFRMQPFSPDCPEPRMEPYLGSLDMDESHLFSVSESDESNLALVHGNSPGKPASAITLERRSS